MMRKLGSSYFVILFCCVLLLGFSADATAAGKIETVEVTGMGVTPEKAIKNATKEAVRQVVGMYVVAEAATKNRKLIKDEVLSASNGFVRKFTTIEKEVDEDGIHTVTAKVEVEVGKLTEALTGLNIATKTVDSDNLTAQIIDKVESAKDFATLAHKVIFEPLEKNKGIYNIDVNFFTGLVNDDDFDEEFWLKQVLGRASDDWVPIQMTMKVSIKDAYFEAIEQFLDKNSKSKMEGENLNLSGKYYNRVMLRDTDRQNVVAWKLGKQNAKSMLKVINRFGANFETYLQLKLLGEGGRNLGSASYVKGYCEAKRFAAIHGSAKELIPWVGKMDTRFITKTGADQFGLPTAVGEGQLAKIKQYVPGGSLVTTRIMHAGKTLSEYDFKKGGKVKSFAACYPSSPGPFPDRAARILGSEFVYTPKITQFTNDNKYGAGMALFEKATDVFTWYAIIFLPPETAKQLKSGKVEIITVQTNEDE